MDELIDTEMEELKKLRQMQIAVWTNNYKTVEKLIKEKTDINGLLAVGFHVPLCLAIWKGYMSIVSLLIDSGASVNRNDCDVNINVLGEAKWVHKQYLDERKQLGFNYNHDTPLITAVLTNNSECVTMLLRAGACVNTNTGWTALLAASIVGFSQCLDILLEADADVNSTWDGWSPLLWASTYGYKRCVESLIRAGANVNQKDIHGKTSIILASIEEQKQCLKTLIAAKADVNLQDNDGNTALIYVTALNNHDCLKILIKAGAHINTVNKHGNTALLFAARRGHVHNVRVLLECDVDVNYINPYFETALTLTVSKGHVTCLDLLIKKGADVNASSPLLLAIEKNQIDCIRYLLKAGADVNFTRAHENVLVDTILTKKKCIAHLLIDAGADINKYDDVFFTTPLIAASDMGYNDIVKKLLIAGANVNSVDIYCDTALMKAARHGDLSTLKILMKLGTEVKKKYSFGHSFVKAASNNEESDCMRFLISHGVDINFQTRSKKTAFSAAASYAKIDFVKYLLSLGACINKGILNFQTFLHNINRLQNPNDQSEMVELLYATGEEIDPEYKEQVESFSQQLQEVTLKSFCRKSITNHLITLDKFSHLYKRVPRIPLPNSLKVYLLYNTSLSRKKFSAFVKNK